MSEQKKPEIQDFSQFFDVENMTRQFQDMLAGTPFAGVDTGALMAAQQKNLEALQRAGEAAAGGTRQLMEKQARMMEQAMADGAGALEKMRSVEPSEALEQNISMVEQAMQKSMADFSEIAETIRHTYAEVSKELEERMEQSLAEFNQAIEQSAKSKSE